MYFRDRLRGLVLVGLDISGLLTCGFVPLTFHLGNDNSCQHKCGDPELTKLRLALCMEPLTEWEIRLGPRFSNIFSLWVLMYPNLFRKQNSVTLSQTVINE